MNDQPEQSVQVDTVTVDLTGEQIDVIFRLCGMVLQNGGVSQAGAVIGLQQTLMASVSRAAEKAKVGNRQQRRAVASAAKKGKA